MADKFGIYAVIAIKLLFEGEDHQRLAEIFSDQAHPALAPSPELRADVVHNRNAAAMHFARHFQIKRGRVNDHGGVGAALVSLVNQLAKFAVDSGQTAENFGDAHNRQFASVDHRIATGFAHAVATHAEKFHAGLKAPQ